MIRHRQPIRRPIISNIVYRCPNMMFEISRDVRDIDLNAVGVTLAPTVIIVPDDWRRTTIVGRRDSMNPFPCENL
jgi:hypothetical protein